MEHQEVDVGAASKNLKKGSNSTQESRLISSFSTDANNASHFSSIENAQKILHASFLDFY